MGRFRAILIQTLSEKPPAKPFLLRRCFKSQFLERNKMHNFTDPNPLTDRQATLDPDDGESLTNSGFESEEPNREFSTDNEHDRAEEV
jgi:hypothetical protein